jgi:hypothetical protein
VSRVPIEVSASERARWLAELAEALEQAERLLWSLPELPRGRSEIMELYASLDAARAEVQALRSRRVVPSRPNPAPFWMKSATSGGEKESI